MRERRSKPEGGRETETESDKTRRKETKGDGERARGRKADGDRGGKFFIPTPMASAGRSSDAIGTQDRHVVHLSRERSASLWTSGRIRGHTSSDQNSIRSRPSARARAVKFPSYSTRVALSKLENWAARLPTTVYPCESQNSRSEREKCEKFPSRIRVTHVRSR